MTAETNSTPRTLDRDTAYAILGVGALVGVALVFWPIFPFKWWWEPLVEWLREGTTQHTWRPVVVVVSVLTGFAVALASFLFVRPLERQDATVRQILYGYNTGLQGVLLLELLLVGCLFVHKFMPFFLDTTQGNFHSISDVTRRQVAELNQPVKVYLFLFPGDPAASNMRALLTTLREINPTKFDFEEVSPAGDAARISDLRERFPLLENKLGVIVAVGDEKTYSIIPPNELTSMDINMETEQRERRLFNGEVRLLQELNFLAENKRKSVIYVTQGHGEPELEDPGPRGIGELAQRLRKDNYDLRPLAFKVGPDGKSPDVPSDADLVMIIGPSRPMTPAIEPLTKFVDPPDPKAKKGKLIVMLGVTPADEQNGNRMRQIGIEELLRKLNVELTNERIQVAQHPEGIMRRNPGPDVVISRAQDAAAAAQHPLSVNFKNNFFVWPLAREVKPASTRPNLRATVVMVSFGIHWKETDMTQRPMETLLQFQRDPKSMAGRLTDEPLGLLVTVSESGGDPHAFMPSNQPSAARCAVFGSSLFATNAFLTDYQYSFVRGTIDWTRERYTSIGVQPKTHKSFTLPEKLSRGKLLFLPFAVMVFGTLGFGVMVWMMRRR